ncbi:glycoside hydrolase family 15 protein, partial [bacterium]|nr:glycoside hydrolase family 15 protein [bacterium]
MAVLENHLNNIRELSTESGLFLASSKSVPTGYNKAWLRDNFYTALAFEQTGDYETVRKVYRAILDIFLKHEYKIDWAVKQKPYEA